MSGIIPQINIVNPAQNFYYYQNIIQVLTYCFGSRLEPRLIKN